MNLRPIGLSHLRVSPLCLGGNVFGWTADEKTSFAILDRFVAEGYNFIDTADVYATWLPAGTGGESETIIGRWLKSRGNRDRIVLATKGGHEMAPDRKGLSKAYLLRAAEDSLRRLQTDYIDLYQSHKDDLTTPQEESLEAYNLLMKQGKIRVIGASNFTADRLSSALAISEARGYPRYECLQPLYNLYDRADFEGSLEKLCIDQRIGVIPYFSLGAGFLTGKYRSEADLVGRARGKRAARYLNERGYRILDVLEQVALETESSPGQVAIAWLLSRPVVTAPIASATNLDQLQELMEAARLQLTTAQIIRLTDAGN